MPPLFTEADIPDRGSIWSKPLAQRGSPTILARRGPAGVSRGGVHIFIIITVLGGLALFALGLTFIYRSYMKNLDREESHRRCRIGKYRAVRSRVPIPSRTVQSPSSHPVRGRSPFRRVKGQKSLIFSLAPQNILPLDHTGSFQWPTQFGIARIRCSAVTDRTSHAPPSLAAPSSTISNDSQHLDTAGPGSTLPVHSQRPQIHQPYNIPNWEYSAPQRPRKAYTMSSSSISQNSKKSRIDQARRMRSMSTEIENDHSRSDDSTTYSDLFESKNKNHS